ncbi:MAG: DUF2156 domain-containing protein [Oscillospiraceae bacterium]|nr:DUF2156 domain-containing protein [Oscillospiraceae bacterium]
MLSFKPITITERPILHKALWRAEGHGSEYSFANLFFWGNQQLCTEYETPLIFSRFGDWTAYLYPRSTALVELLRKDAEERNIPLRIWGLTAQEAQELEAAYPERFSIAPSRNSFDYVYDIERLCSLSGKKLQSKRNHCNRFEQDHPGFQVLPLDDRLLEQCRAFTHRWYDEHAHLHDPSDYEGEKRAIGKAFDHFHELEMDGIALMTEEGLMGFSMGNRIREDMFDVNFEKALAAVNGAYPTVNREFARYIRQKYPQIRLLNREDDMGIEGLRRAKESYYPDILLEKYVAEAVK